jgi:glycosyltransferase involved in cell wall biosynthesis
MALIVVLGGEARSLINFRGPLLASLVSAGHEVIACAPDASEDVQSTLKAFGARYRQIPISRAGVNPLHDLRTLWACWRLFRDARPDLVLAYTIKPVIWGLAAARLARVRRRAAMITGLGYAFTEGGGLRQRFIQWIVCFLFRRALLGVETLMFQNPDDRADFERLGLVPRGSVVIVTNGSGVDVQQYAVSPLPEEPVFLLLARLIGDKGIREYRAAARQLRAKYTNARFLLAGGLDSNPAAISEVELNTWQKEGDVEYLGVLEDVRPALAECRVYVLPSYYREGTPRSVLEAMSAGRAIITTDAPGCREPVEEGVNGFLVPVRSVSAITEAMERFIREPELCKRMGKESRRIAVEKYDVHKVNEVVMRAIGC